MLKLVEYMERRLKEDHINEWDYKLKSENTRICINYVFEYFNNYLTEDAADEKTVLEIERIEKYKAQLENFEQDVQEWLVMVFDKHNKKMNVIIRNFIKKQELFLLFNQDSEFRSLSYECYSQLIKKYQFIRDNTEMIYEVIKQLHTIESSTRWNDNDFVINESITEWIEGAFKKHNVNLVAFAEDWVIYFFDNENLWPARHKKKSILEYRKYDYDYKQKDNLFNINELYRRLPKKSFIRGRKQELEILMMFLWLHTIDGDQEYWEEYKSKVGLNSTVMH
ncbi:hypothetical protein [Paenibacillus lemnae]|uniref:Uncharacterized protein n=1 Tax=Paenibacillus lemnae TaxID=1330551 RepID=A0A848M8T5_PAELE|nr:hypothetical protein [Paenibacillus lemnae]NMO97467.1 hypothetical protein [Paenibacillus lemnae]